MELGRHVTGLLDCKCNNKVWHTSACSPPHGTVVLAYRKTSLGDFNAYQIDVFYEHTSGERWRWGAPPERWSFIPPFDEECY
jgi:hypothetical protein